MLQNPLHAMASAMKPQMKAELLSQHYGRYVLIQNKTQALIQFYRKYNFLAYTIKGYDFW